MVTFLMLAFDWLAEALCRHLVVADGTAVHHPALSSGSFGLEHQTVAAQGLLWARADQGRVVVLSREGQSLYYP